MSDHGADQELTDQTLEEKLIMNRMIERGLADVEAGRTISDEEMAKTIDSWRD
jgi:predicted transcriptional regulator